MNNNCDLLKDLEIRLENALKLLNTNKTDDELKREILDYDEELKRLDDVYNIDKLKSEIIEKENKSKELMSKAIELGAICDWGNNLDSIIKQLNDVLLDMSNVTNPFESLLKVVNDKIILMEKALEKIVKQQNNRR